MGVWTLLLSQIPLPLGLGLPGHPHMGGRGEGKSRPCASVFPRPRLPKEPCQVQRQPCSFWPQPQLSRLSSMLGMETQLKKTVHPPRASSDQAAPLPPLSPPHPCTHSGLGPLWSLGPVQDRETSGLWSGTSVRTPAGAVSTGGGAMVGCPQLGAGPRVRVPITPQCHPRPEGPRPQPTSHPDCPCSTLHLARAARLLTRQKGIATGGWGRKRHRLDARRCLGGQALSTRAGTHASATTAAN